jgi:hypothetical protein
VQLGVDVGDHADQAAVVHRAVGQDARQLFSNTAASTERFISTRSAASQLVPSAVSTWRPSRNTPSLQARPVYWPDSRDRWAMRRATGVLPRLPVTPTTGMRESSSFAKR